MTLIIRPPLKLASQKIVSLKDATEISEQKLRDIVTGKDRSFERLQAMAVLQASDVSDKHVEFEKVLANEHEPSDLRYRAALHLGNMDTPASLQSLIKNTSVRDRVVLTGVVKALGRIGDQSALSALTRVQRTATGHVQKLARFSAALIAHRLGLEEHDLPVPAEKDQLSLPADRVASISLAIADLKEIKSCLKSIGRQTFGISVDETVAYQMTCDKRQLMILFNRDLRRRSALDVGKRKTFLGLVAGFNAAASTYSVQYLLLTSPVARSKTVNIFVALTNGDIAFSGQATPGNESYDFKIAAVGRPGAYAVHIKGNWTSDRVSFQEARTSLKTQIARRTPTEIDRGQ